MYPSIGTIATIVAIMIVRVVAPDNFFEEPPRDRDKKAQTKRYNANDESKDKWHGLPMWIRVITLAVWTWYLYTHITPLIWYIR